MLSISLLAWLAMTIEALEMMDVAKQALGGPDETDNYFQTIRRQEGVDNIDFRNPALWNFAAAAKSAAKSGAIFVPSHGKQFLLKSNNSNDLKGLKSCLPALANHFSSGTKHFTLPVYKCLYSPDKSKSFTVMKDISHGLEMHSGTYTEVDFKGSLGGRIREDWSRIGKYKDNNMMCIFEWIKFDDPRSADQVMRAIRNSAKFFETQDLMDYSLLLRIELGCDNKPGRPNRNGLITKFHSTCKLRGVAEKQRITFHFLGILDYLTPWGTAKSVESWFQSRRMDEPSCVNPARYRARHLAALECVFGNLPSLVGSTAAYESQYGQRYRRSYAQRIQSIGNRGHFWLGQMEAKGAKRQLYVPPPPPSYWPNQLVQGHSSSKDDTIVIILFIVIILVILFGIGMCCFFALRKKERPKKNVRKPRIEKKSPRRRPRRGLDLDEISDEEWRRNDGRLI